MLPLVLLYWICSLVGEKDESFSSFSQLISLLPGKIGAYLRSGFYSLTMEQCASDVHISFATIFAQTSTNIGKGTYIGPQGNIGSSNIGQNCLLGSGVHVLSGNKQHFIDDLNSPIKEQGGKLEKIRIGDNTWIGNNALIMANVGDNCVIAAGAVVTKDVLNNQIVAGNPAAIIRSRDTR